MEEYIGATSLEHGILLSIKVLGGKESVCNAGSAEDTGSIPGSGRSPWRRAWQPTPVFLPGESHGRGSLVGYSPSGHKESDMTEATWHTYTKFIYRYTL